MNGVYFFYEVDEYSNHGDGIKPRIVRIGTSKEGNFRTRIAEHFLLSESIMRFSKSNRKPSDRSIFRKNIGRALLNKASDFEYLKIWEIDFTRPKNRLDYADARDISKEQEIESQITKLLSQRFFFRYLILEGERKRLGSTGLESKLIGTVAACESCKSSQSWLGKYSSNSKISNGKLWLTNFLNSPILTEKDQDFLLDAVQKSVTNLMNA